MDEKKEQTLQSFIRENAFKLAAIAVTALNLWSISQLAPVERHLALVDQRVQAIEQDGPISSREFGEIIKRLDRIEQKVDADLLN